MSNYLLYGQELISNDATLKDFAESMVNNRGAPEVLDDLEDYYEAIRVALFEDISRTDIDYVELMYKYRGEIGEILYCCDNYDDVDYRKIEFFGEGAKVSFNYLVLCYIKYCIEPSDLH